MAIVGQWRGQQIVQYAENNRLLRSIIPQDSEVTPETLAAGIPYGVDLQALFLSCLVQPDAAEFERTLHDADIWTVEDLRTKPSEVRNAVLRSLTGTFNRLFKSIGEM